MKNMSNTIKEEYYTKILTLAKKTINDFNTGYIKSDMGYIFKTRAFLNILFLYWNSVDVHNPDILGKNNKNTFILEVQKDIKKIIEQLSIKLRDINFLIKSSSSLTRFIVKSANRKALKDNNFTENIKKVITNTVVFGSGFLKVWENKKGILKSKSIDPFSLIFDQYNFRKGIKIEKLRTSIREILGNDNYNNKSKTILLKKHGGSPTDEVQDTSFIIYQMIKPIRFNKDGEVTDNKVYILDIENDLVYVEKEIKGSIYFKVDYENRIGFPDALGRGALEKIFNVIVQSKVNRERMDKVMDVVTNLLYQKQVDGEKDINVGKQTKKFKHSSIIGHKGNKIEKIDLGGEKQITFITHQLAELTQKSSSLLNMNDVLQGNTLHSGTSGTLGNLLTENASSVHKEDQGGIIRFITRVYNNRYKEYILRMFNKDEDITKYLDKNDIRLVKENVVNYFILRKQIDASINNKEFSIADAKEEVKENLKGKKLISGELLHSLREEVSDIEVVISGENISKAQTVAFIREIRNTYLQKPEAFKDPFFVETLKKEAEYEQGISPLEIEQLLKEIKE